MRQERAQGVGEGRDAVAHIGMVRGARSLDGLTRGYCAGVLLFELGDLGLVAVALGDQLLAGSDRGIRLLGGHHAAS